MKDRRKLERHERMYGPHFNEKCALKVVSKMINEDGSVGQHWSLPETTSVASQYGVSFNTYKYNKYDWYVALNMVYSDYYKAIHSLTGTDNIKCFVELAKAWLNDKDVEEGKMWYYYKYVINDTYHEDYDDEEDDEEEDEFHYARRSRYNMHRSYEDYDRDYDKDYNRNYSNRDVRERIGSRY